MKISKVNGVRVCSGEKGLLYFKKGVCANDYVQERIRRAKETTRLLYDIFVKNPQPLPKIRKKDDLSNWIKRNLKIPYRECVDEDKFYRAYQETNGDILAFKEAIRKLPAIQSTKEEELLKLQRKTNADAIYISIEKQIVPIYFDTQNNHLPHFENSMLNDFFNQFTIHPQSAYDQLFEKMQPFFQCLKEKLYCDAEKTISKKSFGQAVTIAVYDKAKTIRNLWAIAKEFNAKDEYFISKAIDFIKSDFPKGNDIPKEQYAVEKVIKRASGNARNYIANKCIQRGKYAYYHALAQQSETKWTSFHLEMIEAVEVIRRKFATAFSFAYSNLGGALNKMADENDYLSVRYPYPVDANTDKQIKAFFGGQRFFNENYATDSFENLASQLVTSLYFVRNQTIHYEYHTQVSPTPSDAICHLIKKEFELRQHFLEEKYRSNQIDDFYNKEDVTALLQNSLRHLPTTKAYFPSFTRLKNVLLQKAPPMNGAKNAAFLFLLQEVYYNEFLSMDHMVTEQALQNTADKDTAQQEYEQLMDGIASLEAQAEKVHIEFMHRNTNKTKQDKPKSDHLNIIFRNIVANVFYSYMQAHYPFLFGKEGCVACSENSDDLRIENFQTAQFAGLYVLSKFTVPHQLSELVHTLLKFQQFRRDIIERHAIVFPAKIGCFGDFCKAILPPILQGEDTDKAIENALIFLRTCMQSVGWIAPPRQKEDEKSVCLWQDFFATEGDYTAILGKFIDSGLIVNAIYHDDKNPIAYSGVIHSKMYGTQKAIEAVYGANKVTAGDMTAYANHKSEHKSFFQQKKLVDIENAAELSAEIESRKKHLAYTQNVHKVELFPVQQLQACTLHLYSNLLMWVHIWERDLQFLLLGLGVDPQEVKNIFEYAGSSMGEGLQNYMRSSPFPDMIRKLFFRNERTGIRRGIRRLDLRNQIAHFKNLRTNQYSIFELYNLMRDHMSYSRKHQNAVMAKLCSTLEHFDLEISGALKSNPDGNFGLDSRNAKIIDRQLACNKEALRTLSRDTKTELGIHKDDAFYYKNLTNELKSAIMTLLEFKI